MTPDNHLATMVHKRARDDHNWWISNKLPEAGTEVQFVIHRQEPQLHKDRELRVQKEAKDEAKLKKVLLQLWAFGR